MPKKNKKTIDIIEDEDVENTEDHHQDNDVLVASEYHEQKQHEDEPIFEDEDELFDYAKNMGKNIFEEEKNKAIEEARKDGKPFDLDYQEKGVPVMPVPASITTAPNGKQTFTPIAPWDINNSDPKTTAIVYCTPDGKPLYEDDKKTLKIAKSSDSEFRSVYDDNAPAQIKKMNKIIKDVTLAHEKAVAKTKPKQVVLDKNQRVIELVLKFCKINNYNFNHKLTDKEIKFWDNTVKNEKVKALLLHYNIQVPTDKDKINKFVATLEAGIKRNSFNFTNIKIKKNKIR